MKISDHDMKEFEKMFAPVLDWLDVDVYKKNPENGFNMRNWVTLIGAKDFRGNDCERAVCIIGYLWKHHNFHWNRDNGILIIEDLIQKFDFEDETVAKKVLKHISLVEDKNGNSLIVFLNEIKPYQVASVIRYFLKTGKVKWKNFLTDEQMEKN